MVDITGHKFGLLTATRPTDQRQDGSVVWEFLCECGQVKYKSLRNLKSRRTNASLSCGCLRRAENTGIYDHTLGKRYGHILVIDVKYRESVKKTVLVCLCDCGSITDKDPHYIINNQVTRCSRMCNTSLPEGMSTARLAYNLLVLHARRSGLRFDITFGLFLDLSDMDCHICGLHPSTVWDIPSRRGIFKHSKVAYIDRDLGYVDGNVIPVCEYHSIEIRSLHHRKITPVHCT